MDITIAFSMMDRILAPELLANCIQKDLIPWVKRNQLALDEVLVDYALEILQITRIHYLLHLAVHKEGEQETCSGRIIALLKHVIDPDSKMDVLLNFLHRVY